MAGTVIGVVLALAFQCPDGAPPPCSARASRAAAPSNSVAVLYFDNISRDTGDAYIADGLTEELIARLAHLERLQVKSRTAVQRYRGRPIEDPSAVGRALGVAELVSGSVRRGNGRVRVTVELTRASTGVQVWGDTYERPGDDLMAVESDIAEAIASNVGGRLAPAEQHALAARPTGNPEAYDHFLRGNYQAAQRTGPAVRRAIAEYETAVRLDPGFARAFGRIGTAYGLFIDWRWPWPGVSADSQLALGLAAASRALQLDSLSADAWMAQGLLLTYRYPATFEDVDQAFRRALALDPRNDEAWHQYGSMLAYASRDSAAEDAFEHALALAPERVITLSDLGWLFYLRHRYAEGQRLEDSAIALDPQAEYVYSLRADIELARGDTAAFRADVANSVRTRHPDYLITTAANVIADKVMRGDSAGARAELARFISQFQDPSRPSYYEGYAAARGLTVLGDHDGAIRMLESIQPRGLIIASYARDPVFDPIRNDPRFQRLVAETRPPHPR